MNHVQLTVDMQGSSAAVLFCVQAVAELLLCNLGS